MNARPIIIGGGLAGGAAAARLAVLGARPLLLERESAAHDKICGEFLSVEAAAHLAALGFDVARLGGAPITRVRLHAGRRSAESRLPFRATGLTRRALDWALLDHAEGLGAEVRRGTVVRHIADGVAVVADGTIEGQLLLATGKHELRGEARDPAGTIDDLIGFKQFFRCTPALAAALAGTVAVTAFDGGYAGLQCVEGGRLNLCLVVSRARFRAMGNWPTLFAALLREPGLALLADAEALLARPLTISAVPYGYLARPRGDDTIYRLGDQAAVIPSFCGDGMAMALHGGRMAADMAAAGAPASAFQARLHGDVARQVRLATRLQRVATSPLGRLALVAGLGAAPVALAALAKWTRVAPEAVARTVASGGWGRGPQTPPHAPPRRRHCLKPTAGSNDRRFGENSMRLLPALPALVLAAPALAATEQAGSLDGVAIIDRLDAAAVKAGTTERFWFRAGDSALAQPWLVPVIVVKGARPGPRLLLTAAIHGDELSGIDVIHRLASIDPASLAGTLVMVPGLNTPGLLQSTREWTPDFSRAAPNLNRVMPGSDGGRGIADYAGRLWFRLLRPNADAAVDLHTQSRGGAYPMYAFASTPRSRAMAELVAPDIIKLDPGEKGTVENEMTNDGVPAITLELGGAEVFDTAMVGRGVAGIVNLMREMKMLDGPVVARSAVTFTGNKQTVVRSPRAGFAVLAAPLNSDVAKGDELAILSDGLGRVTDRIMAPVAGRISTIFTDPRRGRGDMIVRIITADPDPKCAMGC